MSDHRPPPHPSPERHTEAAYVMPMTALLLVPLMLFAALATDVGAWYVRAEQTQRAADAAALAGTVFLPDQLAATEAAREAAARNGFRDPAWVAANGGTSNATVTVPGFSSDGGIIVEVETDTPSYFGSLVLSSVNIRRKSVASVNPPIELGNPTNGLGTGNLDSSELGTTPDGVWLSINGWCQDHQQGDPISVGFYGAAEAGGQYWNACNTANLGANPTYDPAGYSFVIDVPEASGDIAIEVFEPGLCTDTNTSDLLYSAEDAWYGGPALTFRVFDNDDTKLYHADNLASTPVVSTTYSTSACTGGGGAGGRWYTVYTIPAGAGSEGFWYVQASAGAVSSERGVNNFALRARPTTDSTLCSSLTDPSCPQLFAYEWLSVFRPNFGAGALVGQPAEFFLAEVSDAYAGKTIEIRMFDPGEGMNNVQFLDPDGNPVDFEWQYSNCSVGGICGNGVVWPETSPTAADSCGASTPCLNVTASRFQDQWLTITTDLDPTYSCGGASCWWQVRYTPQATGTVSDRTTWSVRVIGDPVHLTE